MLTLFSAAEPVMDPIWLRTLATTLPFLGPIVVGLIAAPWVADKLKNKNREAAQTAVPATTESEGSKGLPAPVAIEATERAQADPLLRLLIEDLHERLSAAHQEAAHLHAEKASDAATIARLTAEIDDQEERYRSLLAELNDKTTQLRAVRGRLEELKVELEQTRRKLQICMEGYQT